MSISLPNFIPQAFAYLFSGDDCRFSRIIGVVGDISLESYACMERCFNSLFLQVLYWFTNFGCYFGGVFKYFCEWEPPDIVPSRWSRRILHQNFHPKGCIPMMSVDQCHVVLSSFILHSYISYLFSCTTKWNVYVSELDLIFHTNKWAIYKHFIETLTPGPPDGYIMMI